MPRAPRSILISAGEASGDYYAALLVAELRRRWPETDFFGCAGAHLRAAGLREVVRAEDLAVVGIALKFWFAGQYRVASTLLYIIMGWLCLIVLRPLLAVLPREGFWLLLAGGFCYTGGAAFYLWKRLPYHHAVWHLWVMAGSACHWTAVFLYVVPGIADRPL